MSRKPTPTSSEAEKELNKLEEKFDQYAEELDQFNLEAVRHKPIREEEPQTKLSQRDLEKQSLIYLKPKTTILSREKFNEKYRKDYDFAKEYVQFIAENKEIVGEAIPLWTKPFPGCPAEEWSVPVNKPVWGPRYLAEQIKGCQYSEFHMNENTGTTSSDHVGEFKGKMIVEKRVNRLDARPVYHKKSVFMGVDGF